MCPTVWHCDWPLHQYWLEHWAREIGELVFQRVKYFRAHPAQGLSGTSLKYLNYLLFIESDNPTVWYTLPWSDMTIFDDFL
jgi:hypothetical protein